MRIIAIGVMGMAGVAGLASGQKTAGEVFKNVKVLRDAPQEQFVAAMTMISGSLGVQCTHCHDQPYDRDSKEAKTTARKMIQMTREMNARDFGGKPVVTCNTCHHGALQPEAVPRLGFVPSPVEPSASSEGARATSAEVLAKYRKAVGGDRTASLSMEGFLYSKSEPRARVIQIESIFPDKTALTVTSGGIVNKLVLSGEKAWSFTARGKQDIPFDQARLAVDLLKPVKYSTEKVGEGAVREIVDGRACFRVDSSIPNRSSRLYFDQNTGLLYKAHTEFTTPLGPEPVETVFEDYADVNGVKMPLTITRTALTERGTYRFSKIEVNGAIDPAKLEAAPPPLARAAQ